MIDTKVVGMNWIEVPAGNYTMVHAKRSKCQIEISVRYARSKNATPACTQQRIDGTNLYLIRPRMSGPRSRRFGYSVSILSARVGRVSSRRLARIRLSRSPIW